MKWRPYPRYRESGVEWLGAVPEHWRLPPMHARYRVELGKMLDEKRISGAYPVPYLRNTDVQWDRINDESLPEMDITPAERERFTVREGDLLVCEGGEIGRAAIWHGPSGELGFQKALHRLRPRSDDECPRYLFYTMRCIAGSGVFEAEGNPNTIFHLTGEKLRRYRFPAPSADEQRAIARFLDRETARLETLVGKKRQLIDRLREKRTALISHTVTRGLPPDEAARAGLPVDPPPKNSGVEWIGQVPGHWQVLPLKRALRDSVAGPFGSALTKDLYTADGYRVYGQEQVIAGSFSAGDYYIPPELYEEMRRYRVEPGDVLVSCVGTFGRVVIVPEGVQPGIINPRLVLLRPDTTLVKPRFLAALLGSGFCYSQFEAASRGGTMGVINLSLLQSLVVLVPPLREQDAIAGFLDRESAKIDRLVATIEEAIDRLQEYRAALITAAVTGKIDVRGEVAQEYPDEAPFLRAAEPDPPAAADPS